MSEQEAVESGVTPDEMTSEPESLILEPVSRRTSSEKPPEVATLSLFGVMGFDAVLQAVLSRLVEVQGAQRIVAAATRHISESGVIGVAEACLPPISCHQVDHYVCALGNGSAGCSSPPLGQHDCVWGANSFYCPIDSADFDCQQQFTCTVWVFDCPNTPSDQEFTCVFGNGFQCGGGPGFVCPSQEQFDPFCGMFEHYDCGSGPYRCGQPPNDTGYQCQPSTPTGIQQQGLRSTSAFTCPGHTPGPYDCPGNTTRFSACVYPQHRPFACGFDTDFVCPGTQSFYCSGDASYFQCGGTPDTFSCRDGSHGSTADFLCNHNNGFTCGTDSGVWSFTCNTEHVFGASGTGTRPGIQFRRGNVFSCAAGGERCQVGMTGDFNTTLSGEGPGHFPVHGQSSGNAIQLRSSRATMLASLAVTWPLISTVSPTTPRRAPTAPAYSKAVCRGQGISSSCAAEPSPSQFLLPCSPDYSSRVG